MTDKYTKLLEKLQGEECQRQAMRRIMSDIGDDILRESKKGKESKYFLWFLEELDRVKRGGQPSD